jgi:hypothetical protein
MLNLKILAYPNIDIQMPYCSKCDGEIEELGETGQGICPKCGIVKLSQTPKQMDPTHARYCMNCGKELPFKAAFCQSCGKPRKPMSAETYEPVPSQAETISAETEPIPEGSKPSLTPTTGDKGFNEKIIIGIAAIILVIIIIGSFWYQPSPEPIETTTSQPLSITDPNGDFVHVQGETELNLDPVDINRVTIRNDRKNLFMIIETAKALPEIGPDHPANFVAVMNIMADHDGDKFIHTDIIIDDLGRSIFSQIGSESLPEDRSPIKYRVEGKKLTFIVPLDLRVWGDKPTIVSVLVYTGFEVSPDVRIYDFVPNQNFGEWKYVDYVIKQE